MPKMANPKCIELPMPAAPIAAGPSGPTMIVSTTPIPIQPSSARMTGAGQAQGRLQFCSRNTIRGSYGEP